MPLAMNKQYYPAKGEQGVVGRFDYAETIDIAASNDKGEMVMKMIPVLIAKTAGDSDFQPQKVPTDPIARMEMIQRFPEAWRAFQGEQVNVPGTPLTMPFHGLTMAPSEMMKYEMNGVSRWEQIPDLSDAGCERIGFGTRKKREDVMLAMGMTPPGRPPNIQLSQHMTAEQALLSDPANAELVARLKKAIAEKNGEAVAETLSPAASAGVDLNSPEVKAAIAAAVQAAMTAQAKRTGWPRGKPRGPRKAKAATNETVPTDAPHAEADPG